MSNPDLSFNTASALAIADVANGALIGAKTGVIAVVRKIFFSTDEVGTLKLCSPAGTLIDNFTWYFAANSGVVTIDGLWRGVAGAAVVYDWAATNPDNNTSIKIEWFEEYA